MSKIEESAEFAPDGTKLFNPRKPFGAIYADGFTEGKWFQDGTVYRADRFPVGYGKAAPEPDVPSPEKKLHWTQRKKLEEAKNAASGAG